MQSQKCSQVKPGLSLPRVYDTNTHLNREMTPEIGVLNVNDSYRSFW